MKKTDFFWVLLCLIYIGCQPPTTQTHPSTKNASTYYTEPVQLVWNPQILLKSSRLPRQTLLSDSTVKSSAVRKNKSICKERASVYSDFNNKKRTDRCCSTYTISFNRFVDTFREKQPGCSFAALSLA